MKIAVAVEHHPRRAHLLDDLLPRLAGLDVAVVRDPDPDGEPNSWRTYRECLRLCAYGLPSWDYTHLLVIQDDAEPCRDFAARLQEAVEERPDAIVCLFCSGQAPQAAVAVRRACEAGERWALHPMGWVPVVATVWPTAKVESFLRWEPTGIQPRNDRSEDEVRVGRWARRHCEVWHRVPALVDHPGLEPSLFRRHSARMRVAVCPPD